MAASVYSQIPCSKAHLAAIWTYDKLESVNVTFLPSFAKRWRMTSMASGFASTKIASRPCARQLAPSVPLPAKKSAHSALGAVSSHLAAIWTYDKLESVNVTFLPSFAKRWRMTSMASGFASTKIASRPCARQLAPSVPLPAKKSAHSAPGAV